MQNKKKVPVIVLGVALLLTVLYAFISTIALKPKTTEAEFPFTITYELDGETVTINEVYKAWYSGNGGYANTKGRMYDGEIGNNGENNTTYTLKKNGNTRVELCTYFYPDYMMGDSEYDYFDEEIAFKPTLYYYNDQEQEFHDAETLAEQGVKLISYEYPTPIKNSFTFSHLSYFNCAIVLPILLIAILTVVAVLIFVKKDKELKYKASHIISLVLNFIIGFGYIPLVSILAMLIDIEGGGPEFYYQVMYFIPWLSTMAIAASIALRRRGHGVKSLLVCLAGPIAFALYLGVSAIVGLL